MCGSSPLARGLQVDGQLKILGVGIIPARAGFTQQGMGGLHGGADHPRSRGVYVHDHARDHECEGSSPLARGLRVFSTAQHLEIGIIPARAGFTDLLSKFPSGTSDHPRSRGVYVSEDGCERAWLGSSPLARGLPRLLHLSSNVPRIIPARAGFTPSGAPAAADGGDHPRSRGVYG